MYQDEKNEYGCPLYFQSGQIAIRNFEAIIAGLSPEQRIAFEIERAASWAALEHFLAQDQPIGGERMAERVESAAARLQSDLQITRRLLIAVYALTLRVFASALLGARVSLRKRCAWHA